MTIEIISPEKSLFSGEVELAQFPGVEGSFEVLNNHAPIIAALAKGNIRVVSQKGETMLFDIKGGLVEVNRNRILVLVD